jgi:hypothetical protein
MCLLALALPHPCCLSLHQPPLSPSHTTTPHHRRHMALPPTPSLPCTIVAHIPITPNRPPTLAQPLTVAIPYLPRPVTLPPPLRHRPAPSPTCPLAIQYPCRPAPSLLGAVVTSPPYSPAPLRTPVVIARISTTSRSTPLHLQNLLHVYCLTVNLLCAAQHPYANRSTQAVIAPRRVTAVKRPLPSISKH